MSFRFNPCQQSCSILTVEAPLCNSPCAVVPLGYSLYASGFTSTGYLDPPGPTSPCTPNPANIEILWQNSVLTQGKCGWDGGNQNYSVILIREDAGAFIANSYTFQLRIFVSCTIPNAGHFADYILPYAQWSCLGPNTLNFIHQNGEENPPFGLVSWPATITLTPLTGITGGGGSGGSSETRNCCCTAEPCNICPNCVCPVPCTMSFCLNASLSGCILLGTGEPPPPPPPPP